MNPFQKIRRSSISNVSASSTLDLPCIDPQLLTKKTTVPYSAATDPTVSFIKPPGPTHPSHAQIVPRADEAAGESKYWQLRLRARQLLRFKYCCTLTCTSRTRDKLGVIREPDLELARRIEPGCDETKSMSAGGEADWPKEWEGDGGGFVAFLDWFRLCGEKAVLPED